MAPSDPTQPSIDDLLARLEDLARRIDSNGAELARLREEIQSFHQPGIVTEEASILVEADAAPPGPARPVLILPPPFPPAAATPAAEPKALAMDAPATPSPASQTPDLAPAEVRRGTDLPAVGEPSPGPAIPSGPAGPPPLQAPAPPREDLETRIGAYWFNRIGLLSLIVAFALFARYVHGALQPWHKTGLLYLASAAMAAAGFLLDRRLRPFARPVMAGGLSLAYFTSFASHFIPATACLPLAASLALMLISVCGILGCAERWRSEPTAGLAIFLGYAAALIGSPDAGLFSAVAILFLSGTAAFLMLRHGWLPIQLLAVISAFGSHYLWAVRAPIRLPAEQEFWTHLGFLTSYYLVFLAGELLAQAQWAKAHRSTWHAPQRFAARACGPLSTILFATVGAWAYFRTGIYLDHIHWFLFILAVVQFGLSRYHHALGGRDQSLYVAAGVTFATLGLLNLFQGLTLNLLLAAEALLLLILARQLHLWVLNPLAQAVLTVNFVHYWTSDARLVDTWPVFCGSVATSTVYLVKARLEETWRRAGLSGGQDAATEGSAIRRWFDRLVTPLAHLHGVLAGVLLVYQCLRFFAAPSQSVALVATLVLLTGLLAIVPCRPWHGTLVVIYLALLFVFGAHWAGRGVPSAGIAPAWWLHQGLCIALVATAILSLYWARRRNDAFYTLVGFTHLAFAGGLVFFVPEIGVIPDEWPWIGLAAPLGYWVVAGWPRWVDPLIEPQFSPGWPSGLERILVRGGDAARRWVAVAGAMLLGLAAIRIAPSPAAALWFLGAFSLAAAGWAGLRADPALAAGLLVHLATVALARFGWAGLDPQFVPAPLDWWLAFTTSLAAAALALSSLRPGRAPLWPFSLGSLLLHFAILFLLGLRAPRVFVPLWPWLLCLPPLISTLEGIAVGLRRRDDAGWVGRRRFVVAFGAAATGAVLWAWILALALPPGFPRWRAELLFATTFLALAFGLRSPASAASYGVHLVVAHVVFLLSLFPGDASAEAWFLASLAHPAWTVALLALTTAGGAGAELSLRVFLRDPPPRVRNWLRIGSCYAYLAALLIGAIFCGIQTRRFTEAPALLWAGQLAMASILALIGSASRLPIMTWSAGLHGGLTVWILAGLAVVSPERQIQLHLAGIAIALQLVLMERCLGRIEASEPRPTRLLRRALGVLAGGMLVVAFQWSAEIGGTWTTLGWSLAALALMTLGFLLKFSSYRRVALAIFVASVLRVVLVDLAGLDPLYRICAFLALGLCLVLTSFLYSKYRDEFQKWL